ncbi:hypothetical protein DBA73_02250 [Neisseria gonorrhoeae]
MPSERRPFQTAFLSNRKTVGKFAGRVQSRYGGLHKFKHICSAAMYFKCRSMCGNTQQTVRVWTAKEI